MGNAVFLENDMVIHAAFPEAIACGESRLAAADDDDGDVFRIGEGHGDEFGGLAGPAFRATGLRCIRSHASFGGDFAESGAVACPRPLRVERDLVQFVIAADHPAEDFQARN